jgi:hypothetical protein
MPDIAIDVDAIPRGIDVLEDQSAFSDGHKDLTELRKTTELTEFRIEGQVVQAAARKFASSF